MHFVIELLISQDLFRSHPHVLRLFAQKLNLIVSFTKF